MATSGDFVTAVDTLSGPPSQRLRSVQLSVP